MDIEALYSNPAIPGSLGGLDRAYREFKKIIPKLTRKDLQEWSKTSLAYSLHRPSRRKFKRERIMTNNIDYLWECDLVDMAHLKKENDNVTFLLTCIDTFSKYAWVMPLKRKTSSEVIKAFKEIMAQGRQPKKLRSDKGSEFINKDFQQLLKKQNITFYTANNEVKAAIVERFNRTLKGRMYRYFTAKNTLRYVDNLQDFVSSYNNTYHRSIGMKPSEVNVGNVRTVRNRLFPEVRKKRRRLNNYNVGDYVRLSLKKRMFEKGYLENYTEEIFKIAKVFNTRSPTMYEVEDLNGEKISDRFYDDELQRVYLPKTFVVEEILKRKRKKGKIFYLVRWRGYPSTFDEWVEEGQLEAI